MDGVKIDKIKENIINNVCCCETLPFAGASGIIYIVPRLDCTSYNEFVWNNDKFELIGIIHSDPKTVGFDEALKALKEGKKVTRSGWNGKGMFLYYVPSNDYLAITPAAKEMMDDNGKVHYRAYIALKTVDGSIVPWVASQSDIIEEDWIILD